MNFDLKEYLPYRLNRLSEIVSIQSRPIYRGMFGLNRPDWRVLAALADIGPATATQLGLHSSQHKTKISRAVWSLEQRRWIKRRPDPDDRRSEILELTQAGLQAFDELVAPMQKMEQSILNRLNAEDRAALLRGLTALETAMEQGSAQRTGG